MSESNWILVFINSNIFVISSVNLYKAKVSVFESFNSKTFAIELMNWTILSLVFSWLAIFKLILENSLSKLFIKLKSFSVNKLLR